jgi:hypothetical protein
MTREEHVTRAMLLGLHYDEGDHTYCPSTTSGHLSDFTTVLDADTLEELGGFAFGGGYFTPTNEQAAPYQQRKQAVNEGKIGPNITPEVTDA